MAEKECKHKCGFTLYDVKIKGVLYKTAIYCEKCKKIIPIKEKN